MHLSIINTDLFPVYRVVFCFSYFKTSSCSYSFLQPPAIASVCVCVCVCVFRDREKRKVGERREQGSRNELGRGENLWDLPHAFGSFSLSFIPF